MKKLALFAAAALAVGALTSTATAQEQQRQRGNFNPEDMRKRMEENIRTLLEVKNDDEWKLISARLEKVREARDRVRALSGDFRLLFNIGRTDQGNGGDQGGRTRGPGGPFGGTPNPDAEAFSKAVQNKAPTDELKQRMAKVRDARKAAEADFEKAGEDLRQVLTVRQEAALVAVGLLK